MIIFGATVRKKTLSKGGFYCPVCQCKQYYSLKHVSKWAHIYWLPVFKLNELGVYVECEKCEGLFRESVLRTDSNISTISGPELEEKAKFFQTYTRSQTHMSVLKEFLKDDIQNLDKGGIDKFLAFEFGMMDYCARQNTNLVGVEFLNFLSYYAQNVYPNDSESIFRFWYGLAINPTGDQVTYNAIKLGYESLSNYFLPNGEKRKGYYPPAYLKRTLQS